MKFHEKIRPIWACLRDLKEEVRLLQMHIEKLDRELKERQIPESNEWDYKDYN